jgi:prepilin signal peptidase PulO-like enzyme (type II secretory pathway)
VTPTDTQGEPFRLVVTEVTATVVAGWGLPALAATAGVCSLIMLGSWLRGELRHWLENPKAADQILVPQVLWACLAGSLAFGLVTLAQRGVHPLTVWQTLAMGFWSASLLLAALIDLRSRLLPDRMTLALALFGLALASQNQFVPLDQALLGGLLGYAIPCATNRWAVRSGRTHGPQAPEPTAIGRGDMALLGGVGVWLGPSGVIWVLLASSVLLLVGLATWRVLVLLMRRRSPRTTSGLPMLPMGPAIAACAWIGPASLLQWPAGLDWVAIVADFAA